MTASSVVVDTVPEVRVQHRPRREILAAPRGEPRPYPFEALEAILGGAGASARALAQRLSISHRSVSRWRRSGLTEAQADELAVRCGMHPCQVWPEWWALADRT